jgi:hypothetical protein
MVTITAAWNRFWFTPADPISIAAIRIVTGVALLWTHLTTAPDLLQFIGPHAIIDREAMRQLRQVPLEPSMPDAGLLRSGDQSLWYYFDQPWLVWTVHAIFLVALVCFTIGLFSRVASVVVWLGQLSYIQRAVLIYFGFDAIVAMLTFYLVFAPTGAELAADCWRKRKRATTRSIAANVVLRLLQLHICIVYLSSGVAKLLGPSWRNGTAVYQALHMTDVALLDFARLGGDQHFWLIVSRVGCYFTVATEIGFAFLIWIKPLRWIALLSAWLLQLGIGVVLCLGSFQLAMFAATLAFVPASAIRRAVRAVPSTIRDI